MDDRVRRRLDDLLADAAEAAAAGHWAEVRALASAALALDAGNEQARALVHEADAADDAGGERRQLTVMFCDLVDSTRLMQQADPEVLRDVVRSYRRVLDDAVTRAEGHIALWIGDGALIYFGHPRPHEDDAWRAVNAGLELLAGIEEVGRSARRRHSIKVALRVAIHTGLVVRAEMGTPSAPDRDAIIGATPNIAARLQDKARPGTVLISEETHDLVRGRFSVIPAGPFALKGIEGRVSAYEVTGASSFASGVETLAERGSFIGREAELSALQSDFDAALEGEHRATLLVGDPGIGKTRLVAELRRHALDNGARALSCGCSAFHTSTPLFPVRRLIELAAGIESSDDPARAVPQLRDALSGFGREDALPVVAHLLGIPQNEMVEAPALDSAKFHQVALDVLTQWVAAEAASAPLLVFIDDIQWADATTMQLLGQVVARRMPGLMLVLAARTGFRSPWSETSVPVMALGPLDHDELAALAMQVIDAPIDAARLTSLVQRSDGVPLFVEELAQAEIATQRGGGEASTVPAALRDPLLSRLAAASGDLALAQIAATIGDEIKLDLLRDVAGLPEERLRSGLAALLDAGLLVPAGDDPLAYRFHHQLLAELAYDTQLLPIRRQRHSAIADALVQRTSEGAAPDAVVEAHHLERAERHADAIRAYVRAATRAQVQGAHTEALEQQEHALGLVTHIDDYEERLTAEILARAARGYTTMSTLGFAAPGAAEDYERCTELLSRAEPHPDHANPLIVIFAYYLMAGQLARAEESNRIRARLDASGATPSDAVPAMSGVAMAQFFRGNVNAALEDIERFLATDWVRNGGALPKGYPAPTDGLTLVLGAQAAACAMRGDLAGARRAVAAGEARAEALPFPQGPYSAAFMRCLVLMVWFAVGDEEEAQQCIDDIRLVVEKHGITFYEVVCNCQAAGLRVRFGEPGGTDHMRMMNMVWQATGALVWMPVFHYNLAYGLEREGDHAGAMEALAEAILSAQQTGAHYWTALILTLRGRVRLALGDEHGIVDMEEAADLAQRQGTRLFELHARLARYRAVPDDESRESLSSVVAEFPDGADDLPELVEARRLLAEPAVG